MKVAVTTQVPVVTNFTLTDFARADDALYCGPTNTEMRLVFYVDNDFLVAARPKKIMTFGVI